MIHPDSSAFDTLIVGGGIIGLSLAWELSKRGQHIAVVEKGEIGERNRGASSWAGAGILPPTPNVKSPDPYEQLLSRTHELHPLWARELTESTGIDTGFRKCGGIYLATSAGELATLLANEHWWTENGIPFERLDKHSLRELEPNLSHFCDHQFRGGWLLPEEWQLRNPDHLSALRAACSEHEVVFFEGQEVQDFEFAEDGYALAAQLGVEQIHADHFCLCGGAWTRLLLEELELETGLMPIRGQMLLYEFEKPPFAHVINEGNRYLVSRSDGHLLAGSIEEEVGYAAHTTEEGLQRIQDWAEGIFPQLSQAQLVDSWAGLRPGSFDGFPYLGQVPDRKNLFVAAGHFRSGLHLSCVTAECMADLIEGKEPKIDLTPFRIGRG